MLKLGDKIVGVFFPFKNILKKLFLKHESLEKDNTQIIMSLYQYIYLAYEIDNDNDDADHINDAKKYILLIT